MHKPLAEIADIQYGRSPNEIKDINGSYNIYGSGGLVGKGLDFLFDKAGTVVARKGTLGNPTFAEGKYWVIDTAYAAIPKNNIDPKWLYYCLDNYDLEKLNEATGVPSISRDYLYRIKIHTPPLPQQQKIAKILSTVDRLIEQTQKLIDKYSAIKQGMMADLFTRGIDLSGDKNSNPNYGELRPSQGEAPKLYKQSPLGWIPKDWEIRTLGDLAEFRSGYAFKNEELSEGGMKVVRISNLHKPDFPYWHYNGNYKSTWITQPGDLLFSWAGVASSIDAYTYTGEPALLNQHIYNFIIPQNVLKSHVYNHLQYSLPKIRESIEGGAGQLHLSKGKIESISIPVPNNTELIIITDIMKSINDNLNKETDFLESINKIKKGLMQDLLTGKVSC